MSNVGLISTAAQTKVSRAANVRTHARKYRPTRSRGIAAFVLSFLAPDPLLVSIVASIPACHAGDRGSIPRRGDSFHLVSYRGNVSLDQLYQNNFMMYCTYATLQSCASRTRQQRKSRPGRPGATETGRKQTLSNRRRSAPPNLLVGETSAPLCLRPLPRPPAVVCRPSRSFAKTSTCLALSL